MSPPGSPRHAHPIFDNSSGIPNIVSFDVDLDSQLAVHRRSCIPSLSLHLTPCPSLLFLISSLSSASVPTCSQAPSNTGTPSAFNDPFSSNSAFNFGSSEGRARQRSVASEPVEASRSRSMSSGSHSAGHSQSTGMCNDYRVLVPLRRRFTAEPPLLQSPSSLMIMPSTTRSRETRTSTKALTDELMRMQEDVSTLQSEMAPMVKRLDLAEENMAVMTKSIERIDKFGARIQAWGLSETEHRNEMQLEVGALKNDVRTLHNTIDRIFAIVKDAGSGSGSGSGSGDDEDPRPFATATQALSPPSLWTEEERASMIQGIVRYFMHRAMNMLDHQDSPPTPLTDGRFWTVDDVESASRFLRPHWDSWGPNASAWFREIVQKIIEDGP
ncbi:hypothetical protein BC629DRAFT_1477713 [Irpex lacteus]|nr:hypothetical protein BC629DRAFT_1477713 [Irpex lacteus]